jgi:hypothetical protein
MAKTLPNLECRGWEFNITGGGIKASAAAHGVLKAVAGPGPLRFQIAQEERMQKVTVYPDPATEAVSQASPNDPQPLKDIRQ